MPDADVEVTKVVLGAATIRAIGDAAPGDLRTTRTDYQFEWRDNLMPIPVLLPQAPPGVYSEVELRIAPSAASADAVNIIGRANRGGTLVPFEIDNNTSTIPISVTVHTELAPRQIAVTSIEVDVAALVDSIDWSAVPLTTDGRLYITDGDPAMASVVASLGTAFRQR